MRRLLRCGVSSLMAFGLMLLLVALLQGSTRGYAAEGSVGQIVASAGQRVAFTKEVSIALADVGQRVTFRLAWQSLDQYCCPLNVTVVDTNPAPEYLRILASTITGGAWYSPTIDGVVWMGEVVPGEPPTAVSFQVEVLGMPPGSSSLGYPIINRAVMVDRDTIGSLPNQMAAATLVLAEHEQMFLPFVTRQYVPVATQVRGGPRDQSEEVEAMPAATVARNELVDVRSVRTDSDHTVLLPLIYNGSCRPALPVDSPFGLEIAALHEVTPTQGLGALDEQARTQSAFSHLADALVQSGAGWTRVHIAWKELQPEPPPAGYAALRWYDDRLKVLAGTGVQVIATVADAPYWAADVPCAPIYADRLDEFGQFLTRLVLRYKGPPFNIHHWELINEPDSVQRRPDANGLGCWADASTDQDGRRYAEMLEAGYHAIKAADPEATVLMGGVAHDWFTEYPLGKFDRYFPDDVMQYEGDRFIDVLNIHYFPDFADEWERWVPEGNPPTCGLVEDRLGTPYEGWGIDLGAKVNHFRNRLFTCFGVDKPLWVTELAEHGYAGDTGSLERQAQYVIMGFARGLAAGAQQITWYALTTPNDPYEQGLLYADWSPKPAFYAYQTMTSELTGYVYHSTPAVTKGEAYTFVDSVCSRAKTVAWCEDCSGLLTTAQAVEIRVVDRWGSATFVLDGGPGDADGAQNGSIALRIDSDPVFVSVER